MRQPESGGTRGSAEFRYGEATTGATANVEGIVPPAVSVTWKGENPSMHRRDWWKFSAIGLIVPAFGGCRDSNPPAAFYRNLGSEDVLLLPVASVTHDVTLARGTADWVPFRELTEDATGSTSEDAKPSGETNTETEKEIRDLLEEYNELVAERDIEELQIYHIEAHQETVKSWYEMQFALLDKLAEVQTALAGALPDSHARIDKAFAPLKKASAGLLVETLTVENENLVIGKLAAGGVAPMCRFVILEDEWFIDLPNLSETFAQLKPNLDGQMSKIDRLKLDLESGSKAAEQVLEQLETLAKASSTASDKASSTTDTDNGDAPSDAEPD